MAQLGTAENINQWYSNYRRYDFYSERANWINQAQATGKILVAGAGFGYLVDELVALGRDAYGFDAADYCVNNSVRAISKADMVNRTQLAALKTQIGVSGAIKIPCVVTEDLLPCMTDAEITTALSEIRRVTTTLLHIITPGDPNDPAKMAGLNWKSIDDWKTLVGTDLIYNAETKLVI